LLLSDVVLTSHPFAAMRSQSAKPGSHAKPHVPPVQVRDEFGWFGHESPHALQLFGSPAVFTSMVAECCSPAPPLLTPGPGSPPAKTLAFRVA